MSVQCLPEDVPSGRWFWQRRLLVNLMIFATSS